MVQHNSRSRKNCDRSSTTLVAMLTKPLCAAALCACYLFLLGSVTQSPDSCAATQDFVYPLATPLLILGSIGWLGGVLLVPSLLRALVKSPCLRSPVCGHFDIASNRPLDGGVTYRSEI